jgi:SSS family solute:Na+ symporter
LADPVSAYPALAAEVLPVGLLGLFVLAVMATVMSSVDSYSFLAAATFGNDILRRLDLITPDRITRYTRIGLVLTMLLAIGLALFFRSVVEIWYVFGSIGTPALLLPVFLAFIGRQRLTANSALASITFSGGLSLSWWLSQYLTSTGDYWLGLEPIFPGLLLSFLFLLFSRRDNASPLPK